MYELQITSQVKKFIKTLLPKHKRQVKDYILALKSNPRPNDVKSLIGYKPYLRGDIGEYRVIYRFDRVQKIIKIVLVGKRNDNAVYKKLKQSQLIKEQT